MWRILFFGVSRKFNFIVFFVALFALILTYFYGINLIREIPRLRIDNTYQKYFIIGFGIGLPLFYALYRSKYFQFFVTQDHEFTHMFWALLTFKKPVAMQVSNEGAGFFAYQGKKNLIIALAPYFFQTTTFFLLLLYLIINWSFHRWFFLALGAAAGYHLATDFREISIKQSDLHEYGFIPSLIIIIFLNILSYGALLGFLINRWSGMWYYLKDGFLDFTMAVANIF